MATVIDSAYIKLDLDTKLFDRKFKLIKDQIARIQKMQMDINSKVSSGKGGAGGLAQGAVAGVVAGGVVGSIGGGGGVGGGQPNVINQVKDTGSLLEQWKKVGSEYLKFLKDLSKMPDKIKEANAILDQFIQDKLGVALDSIEDIVINLGNMPKEFDAITRAALYFRNALIEIKNVAKDLGITGAITNGMIKSMSVINQFASNLKTISKDIVQWFKDDFETLPDKIKSPIKKIASIISNGFSGIKSIVSNKLTSSLLGAVKNATLGLIILMGKAGKLSAKSFILGLKTLNALRKTALKIGYQAGTLIALGIRGGLRGIGKIIGGVKNTILKSFRFLRGAIIGVIGAFAVPIAGLIKQIADQKATANLETSFAATSKTIGVTADKAKELVHELDRTTDFDFTELSNGAANLSTFTNITGERFKEVLGLATDLSAAFGQDLKSSVIQLGKAFNNPVKGIAALSRVGVSFTEEQKEEIKRLVEEENNLIGAHKLMLKVLDEQGIRGQAKAMADPITQVKKGIQDWWKTVGLVVGRFFEIGKWIGKVRGKIDELNKAMLEFSMSQTFANARASAIYFFDVMSAGVMLIVDNFSQLTTRFSWLQDVLRELGYVADWVGKGIGDMFEAGSDEGSWEKFNKRMEDAKKAYEDNVKKPIEANDIIIGGTKAIKEASNETKNLGEEIKKAISISQGAGAIWANAITALNNMLGKDKKDQNKIADGFANAVGGNNVAGAVGNSKTSVAGMIVEAIKAQTDILHKDLTDINKNVMAFSPVV